MGLSLRDQLIAAGFEAKKPERKPKERPARDPAPGQRAQRPPMRRPEPAPIAPGAALAAQREQAGKFRREQEEARKLADKLQRRERVAQLRSLIERHRLAPVAGEDFYNFIDDGRVRRVPVNPELRAGLTSGEVLIARCSDRYDLVRADAAGPIREFDASALLAPQTATPAPAAAPTPDDPYRDYVVPDDLTW